MNRPEFDHVILGAGIVGIWLARKLLESGRSVALVEIGPAQHKKQKEAVPALFFSERANVGAIKARNHVLTGNSAYWGGGLIRNNYESIRGIFGLAPDDENVFRYDKYYEAAERRLNIHSFRRAAEGEGNFVHGVTSELAVLPGSRRGLWRDISAITKKHTGLRLFCEAEVCSVDFDNENVRSITVLLADGSQVVLAARKFVVTMGAVDSNLFVMRHLLQRVACHERVGRFLHDHWSVPIARLAWKRHTPFDAFFPPRFQGGLLIGRRIEIRSDDSMGTQGFVHFQAAYDSVEPYATIKNILYARQQGQRAGANMRHIARMAVHGIDFLRLAYYRVVKQELFVPDDMQITVTLDFESFPSERNQLRSSDGKVFFDWDVRDQDVNSFGGLLESSSRLIERLLAEFGPQTYVMAEPAPSDRLSAFLKAHAVDAYHLGGGLEVASAPGEGVVDHNFRFWGTGNMAIISTAVFKRPGIANPVLTLLAMCEHYCDAISDEERT